ncbi:MAG: SRPBCC family protein [Blastocatellia bacterium]
MNNNEKTLHVVRAAAATALAAYGFKRGGVVGTAVGIVGAGLTASELAAASGRPLTHSTPLEVRQSIEVMASPEEAYGIWSHFGEFPRFMANVIEVRKTGDRTWHWVAEAPLGQRVEWDAEMTADEPGEFIAWRSITAGVDDGGEVHFERTEHGTRVLVIMTFGQPVGPIGAVVAKVSGSAPDALVRQDLRRFKQLIEAGGFAHASGLWESERMRLTAEAAQ